MRDPNEREGRQTESAWKLGPGVGQRGVPRLISRRCRASGEIGHEWAEMDHEVASLGDLFGKTGVRRLVPDFPARSADALFPSISLLKAPCLRSVPYQVAHSVQMSVLDQMHFQDHTMAALMCQLQGAVFLYFLFGSTCAFFFQTGLEKGGLCKGPLHRSVLGGGVKYVRLRRGKHENAHSLDSIACRHKGWLAREMRIKMDV